MAETTQEVAIIRSFGGLVFDAVFTETYDYTLNVTDNPVETGVQVSDHAYMSPLKLTISAGVSDTPLNIKEEDPFAHFTSRTMRAFALLTELQKKAEPFNVQTGLNLYENMVCIGLRFSQDKDSGSALVFDADLRQVIIVSTQTIKYPPRKAGKTKRQASPKKNKGEQQGKEADKTGKETEKKQSLIKRIKGALS